MIDIKDIETLTKILAQRSFDKTVGFVPTMGALHQGHLSLIETAKRDNDIVIVSIFVNPTQFNDPKDYQTYPDTIEQDKKYLENLNVDFLFLPTEKEIYPEDSMFSIDTDLSISKQYEGEYRKGHFQGVLTVVMKLFQLVKPTRAYFGEKDYQQSVLVTEMVKDFFMPIEVITCPTVRESSGLPMSSRNQKLSLAEKRLAESAYGIITKITLDNVRESRDKLLELGVDVDYLDCFKQRVFSAIRIGGVRLIDNILIRHFCN